MHVSISNGANGTTSIGVITVFEVKRSFTELDRAFLSFVAYLVSQKAGERDFESHFLVYQFEQKLHDLIRGEIPEDSSWLDSIFGSGQRNMKLYLIDTKTLSTYNRDSVRFTLLMQCSFCTCIVRGSYLVYITNAAEHEEKKIRAYLMHISEQYNLSVGISMQFHDALKLKKYYTQAKRARDYGTSNEKECGLFAFEELKYQILFRDVATVESPELFVSEDLNMLRTHDKEEGTEYCLTLSTYLRCGMNNDRTRSELNIHRNTLGYRLNRIEEILGHSLSDGAYLVDLYLAGILQQAEK